MPRPAHIFPNSIGVAGLLMVSWITPLLAQDAVNLPLDLDALPDVSEDADWDTVATPRVFRWEVAVGVRRESNFGPLAALIDDPDTQAFSSLALNVDWSISPSLSLRGRWVGHIEDGNSDAYLQSATLRFAPPDVPLRLSLGKEYIAWSFTEFAHVLDPSPRETARIDANDTYRDDANPYASVSFDLGAHTFTGLVLSEANALNDIQKAPRLYALRYETQIRETSLTLQAIHREGIEREFAFGLNTPVGPAILSFEASVADGRRLSVATPLPGGGVLTDTGANDTTYQAVIAARVPLSAKWQVEAAYLYNGHGYTDGEWSAFRTTEAAVLDGLRSGSFTFANFLSEAEVMTRDQYLRRNYLTIAFSTLEDLGKWSMTLGATHGFDDGGTFGFATASRPVGKSGRLDVSFSGGFGGNDTEFSRRSTEASIQMVWEF